MTRVASVLVEKQFLTAASDQHLKVWLLEWKTTREKPTKAFSSLNGNTAVPQATSLWTRLFECCACPPSTALSISPTCFGKGNWDRYWELCVWWAGLEPAGSGWAAAWEQGRAVSALVHGSPSWALALWQRWCLKWCSESRDFVSRTWAGVWVLLVYLLYAFTLILRMGRMGPVEEDQTCLTSLLELKVEISLLAAPPSQGEA